VGLTCLYFHAWDHTTLMAPLCESGFSLWGRQLFLGLWVAASAATKQRRREAPSALPEAPFPPGAQRLALQNP